MTDSKDSEWWEYSPWSWFHAALTKYRSDVIVDEAEADYPPEFLKAVGKYADKKFIFQAELVTALQKWKQYIKAHPELLPNVPCVRLLPDERKEALDFQNLVLGAVFRGDREFLQLLLEVSTLSAAPEPDMHGVRAVIAAFSDLFRGATYGEGWSYSEEWPTKKEVRQAAEVILKKAGLPVPGDREWPRIFRKAGLTKLRSGTRARCKCADDLTSRKVTGQVFR